MAENLVSYWESSSSSAGSNDSDNNSNNNNNQNSNASNDNDDANGNDNDANASNNSSTASSTDSWKSHPWPPDPLTTATAAIANRDLPTDDEEEVIFELNEDAMAQLPAHLQLNMRNIQRERMERVERENAQVPVRRYRAQREREEEEKRRADEWFRGLVGRLPPPPVLGLGVGRRRDEGGGHGNGGGDERNASPSPRGPGRRGRAWREQFTRRVSEGRDNNNNDNDNVNHGVEDLYTDGNGMEHAARHARGRKVHHHHHRAASSKGKAAVYNNQPYLPGSQSAMGQYHTRHGEIEDQQEEKEYDEGAGSWYWKKRAGMHRVKRSIGKMSRVFRKE